MLNQQYADLAELAGQLVHEIKNHVSTLGLNLQLLGEDFSDPQSPRERRALERVERLKGECDRLVDVSNDFLRFARVKDLERKMRTAQFDLDDFLTQMQRVKKIWPSRIPRKVGLNWRRRFRPRLTLSTAMWISRRS